MISKINPNTPIITAIIKGILSPLAGLKYKHLPILDQGVASRDEMDDIVNWIDTILQEKGSIMIHCVGGLGRSGLVAAAYLIKKGISWEKAIEHVRVIRSPRAIESTLQEQFLRSYH
jgi:protein-tyrosine phosphatase